MTKPCEGKLSEETQLLLRAGKNRADWGLYTCETCGKSVGVLIENGKWAAEKHWPSVKYIPRKPNLSRYAAAATVPAQSHDTAEHSEE